MTNRRLKYTGVSFAERLAGPDPVVLDGAMGTELFRRGMVLDKAGWSAMAALSSPDLLRQIHADYARAGAEVHITNTFATSRHILETLGHGDKVAEINRAAVTLCREAMADAEPDHQTWIAGSISTYAHASSRAALPPLATLRETFAEQCNLLTEAGADALALEMLMDADITGVMVEAAAATGLPYWLGFTCRQSADAEIVCDMGGYRGGRELPFEDILRSVLAALPAGGHPILSIMHNELDVTDRALDIAFDLWDGPVVVYPNSGDYLMPGWDFETVCSPEDFVAAADRWLARGVNMVGGCCGLGPAHIEALNEHLACHLTTE